MVRGRLLMEPICPRTEPRLAAKGDRGDPLAGGAQHCDGARAQRSSEKAGIL